MFTADSSRWTGIAVAVVITAVVIAYQPALHGEFIFDDRFEILANDAIHTLWPPWIPMFTGGTQPHRPIPYYTFAINHAAGGLRPFGYHAFNLGVHLVNGGLAWLVVNRTLLQLRERGHLPRLGPAECGSVAFASAAIWLAHPLCTQAVSYVYQRMESLAAVGMLLTLTCFLHSLGSPHGRWWRGACVSAAAMAVLCKESAAAVPFCVGLYLIVLRPDPGPLSFQSGVRSLWRSAGFLCSLATSWILAAAVVLVQPSRYSEIAAPVWTPLQYLMSQPRSLARYLQLAVWPAGQTLDYLWTPPSEALDHVPGLLAFSALAALFFWGIRCSPGVSLGIGISLLLLAPTSTILPVADLCVEHRMYLPLLPLVCVVVTACAIGVGSQSAFVCITRLFHGWQAILALGGGMAVALAVVTWDRNHAYGTEKGMWEAVLAVDPDHQRAAAILAQTYATEGHFELMEKVCRQGLSANRQFVEFQSRLLTMLAVAIMENGGSSEEALACARRASTLTPNLVETHVVYGGIVASINPYEAAAAYERALAVDPLQAQATAGLNVIRERIRQMEKTRE